MLVFRVAGAQSIEPSSGMRAMELVVAKNKPKSEWRQPRNRNEMNLSKGCQNVSFKYVYFIVLARARVFIYSHSDLYGFALCNSALEDVDRHWTLNLAGKWNRKVPPNKSYFIVRLTFMACGHGASVLVAYVHLIVYATRQIVCWII